MITIVRRSSLTGITPLLPIQSTRRLLHTTTPPIPTPTNPIDRKTGNSAQNWNKFTPLTTARLLHTTTPPILTPKPTPTNPIDRKTGNSAQLWNIFTPLTTAWETRKSIPGKCSVGDKISIRSSETNRIILQGVVKKIGLLRTTLIPRSSAFAEIVILNETLANSNLDNHTRKNTPYPTPEDATEKREKEIICQGQVKKVGFLSTTLIPRDSSVVVEVKIPNEILMNSKITNHSRENTPYISHIHPMSYTRPYPPPVCDDDGKIEKEAADAKK